MLVLGDLLARRTPEGQFTAAQITSAFYDLSVPPPGNVGTMLGALRKRGHVLRHPVGLWGLTPLGAEAVLDLGLEVASEVERHTVPQDGAEFAHVDHTVIPSWAAPPRWLPGIRRLQERHPFEQNVFCMTRFPSEGDIPDPVADAIEVAREVLAGYSLTLHLASDAIVEDDLLGNVGAYMWACRYGLAIVEDRVGRDLNYNAVIEVGGMIVTGRRCTILKDHSAPSLPTDLAGQIYRAVDLDDLDTVSASLHDWAGSDLGLSSR